MLSASSVRKKGFSSTGRAALAPSTVEETTYAEHVERIAVIVEQRAAFSFLERQEVSALFQLNRSCGSGGVLVLGNGTGSVGRAATAALSGTHHTTAGRHDKLVLPPKRSGSASGRLLPAVETAAAADASGNLSLDNISFQLHQPAVASASHNTSHEYTSSSTAYQLPKKELATPPTGSLKLAPIGATPPARSASSSSAAAALVDTSGISNQLKILDMVLDGAQRHKKEQQYLRLAQMLAAQRERDEAYMAANSPSSRGASRPKDIVVVGGGEAVAFQDLSSLDIIVGPAHRLESPIPPVPVEDGHLDSDIGSPMEGEDEEEAYASSTSSYDGAEGIALYLIDRDELHVRGQIELDETLERRVLRKQKKTAVPPNSSSSTRKKVPRQEAENTSLQFSRPSTTAATISSRDVSPQRNNAAAAVALPLLSSSSSPAKSEGAGKIKSTQSIEIQTMETLHQMRARDLYALVNATSSSEETRRDLIRKDEEEYRSRLTSVTSWSTLFLLEAVLRAQIRQAESNLFIRTLIETSRYVQLVELLAVEAINAMEMHFRAAEAPFLFRQAQWRSVLCSEQRNRKLIEGQATILFRRTFVRLIEHLHISEQRYRKFDQVRVFLYYSTTTTDAERRERRLVASAETVLSLHMYACLQHFEQAAKLWSDSKFEATSVGSIARMMNLRDEEIRLNTIIPNEEFDRSQLLLLEVHVRECIVQPFQTAGEERAELYVTSSVPVLNEIELIEEVWRPEEAARSAIERDEYHVVQAVAHFFDTVLLEHARTLRTFQKVCDMHLAESRELLQQIDELCEEQRAVRQRLLDEEDEYWYVEFEIVFRRLVRVDTIKSFVQHNRLYEGKARAFVEHECFTFYVALFDFHDQLLRVEDYFRNTYSIMKAVFTHFKNVQEHLWRVVEPESQARDQLEEESTSMLSRAQNDFSRSCSDLVLVAVADMRDVQQAKSALFDQSANFAHDRRRMELEYFNVHQMTLNHFAASYTMLVEPYGRFRYSIARREAMLEFTIDEEGSLRYLQEQVQRRSRHRWIILPAERSHLIANEGDERQRLVDAYGRGHKGIRQLAGILCYLSSSSSSTLSPQKGGGAEGFEKMPIAGIEAFGEMLEQQMLRSCRQLESELHLLTDEAKQRRWIENRKAQHDDAIVQLGQTLPIWAGIVATYLKLHERIFQTEAFFQQHVLDQIELALTPEAQARRLVEMDTNGVWFLSLRYHRWFRDAAHLYDGGLRDHEDEVGRDAATQAISSLLVVETYDRTAAVSDALAELKTLTNLCAKAFSYMHAHEFFAAHLLDHRQGIAVIWKEETAFAEQRIRRLFYDLPAIEESVRQRKEKEETTQRSDVLALRDYWRELDFAIASPAMKAVHDTKAWLIDQFREIAASRFVIYRQEENTRVELAEDLMKRMLLLLVPARRLLQLAGTLDASAEKGFREAYGDAEASVLSMRTRLLQQPRALRVSYFALQDDADYPETLDLGTYDGEHHSSDETFSLLLSSMRGNTHMKHLAMAHLEGRITPAVVVPLVTSLTARLISLDMSYCALSDHDLYPLLRTNIKDPECQLRNLMLHGNKLSAAFTKEMIAAARSSLQLHCVTLYNNSDVSKAQCDVLSYYCDLNKEGKYFKDLVLAVESDQAGLTILSAASLPKGVVVATGDTAAPRRSSSGVNAAPSSSEILLAPSDLEADEGRAALAVFNDNRVRLLAVALCTNRRITTLDFSSQDISDQGALALAKALRANAAVGSIDLSFNKMSDVGVQAIEAVLDTQQYRKPLLYAMRLRNQTDEAGHSVASLAFKIGGDAGFALGVCGNEQVSERRMMHMASVMDSYDRSTIETEEEREADVMSRAWDLSFLPCSILYTDMMRDKQNLFHVSLGRKLRDYVGDVLVPLESMHRQDIVDACRSIDSINESFAVHCFIPWTRDSGSCGPFAALAETYFIASISAAAMEHERMVIEALEMAKRSWEPSPDGRDALRTAADAPETSARGEIDSSEVGMFVLLQKLERHLRQLYQVVFDEAFGAVRDLLDDSAMALDMDTALTLTKLADQRAEQSAQLMEEEASKRHAVALVEIGAWRRLTDAEHCDRRNVNAYAAAAIAKSALFGDSSDAVAALMEEAYRRHVWEPTPLDRDILRVAVDDLESDRRQAIAAFEAHVFRTGIDRTNKFVVGLSSFEKKCVAALQLTFERSMSAVLVASAAPLVPPATEPRQSHGSRMGSAGSVRSAYVATPGGVSTPTPLNSPAPNFASHNSVVVTPTLHQQQQEIHRSPSQHSLQSGGSAAFGAGDRKIQQALNHLHTQPWDLQTKGKSLTESDPTVTVLDLSYAGTNPEEPPCSQDTIAILYALTRRNNQLRELNLSGNKGAVTARSAPLLLKMCAQTKLAVLHLADCGLRDEDIVPHLTVFLGLPECRLTTITLDKNAITPEGATSLCKGLRENTSVTTFRIAQNAHAFGKVTMDFLSFYVGANKYGELFKHSIRRLESNDANFKIVSLVGPAGGSSPDKRVSPCAAPSIDDQAVKYLCISMSQNKVVEQLILAGNSISDKGAKFLSFLAKNATSLRVMDLSNNDIGDAGAKELLGAAQAGKHLQEIRVQNNPQMSAPARRLLAAQLQQNANKGGGAE